MNETRSTYIKKAGEGRYEFGFSFPNRNFRKQALYEPVGERATLAEAETARAELEATA